MVLFGVIFGTLLFYFGDILEPRTKISAQIEHVWGDLGTIVFYFGAILGLRRKNLTSLRKSTPENACELRARGPTFGPA